MRKTKIIKRIMNWKLTKIEINHDLFVKDKMNIGLWLLYPYKYFAIPAGINYVIHPALLENVKVGDRIDGLSLTAVTRVSIITSNGIHNKLLVEMLPPKDTKKIRKYLLVVRGDGKETGVGAYRDLQVLRGNEYLIWTAYNESATGRHWIKYLAFLMNYPPKDNDIVLYDNYTTSLGNVRDSVILPIAGKKVPAVEELEARKINDWVMVKKVRDNVEGKEYEMLELEYHEARKTPAYTTHDILTPENVVYIGREGSTDKTHWKKLYRILRHPVKVRTVRMTNNGNRRVREVEI